MGVLSDTTNVNARNDQTASQATKTFSRRSKSTLQKTDSDASVTATQPKSIKAQIARSPDLSERTSNTDGTSPASHISESQASNATTDADSPESQRAAEEASYSWLRLRNHRRSSVMIVPSTLPNLGVLQHGLVGLAQQQAAMQQRAKIAARQRVLTIQEMIQQLVDYYQEIDAFELVEETADDNVVSNMQKGCKNNSKMKSKAGHKQQLQQQQDAEKQQALTDAETDCLPQWQHTKEGRLSSSLPNRTSMASSRRQRFSSLAPIPGSPTHEHQPQPHAETSEQGDQQGCYAQQLDCQQQQERYSSVSLRHSRVSIRRSTLPSGLVTEHDDEGEGQECSAIGSNQALNETVSLASPSTQLEDIGTQASQEQETSIQNVETTAADVQPQISYGSSNLVSVATETAAHVASKDAIVRCRSTRKSSVSAVHAVLPATAAHTSNTQMNQGDAKAVNAGHSVHVSQAVSKPFMVSSHAAQPPAPQQTDHGAEVLIIPPAEAVTSNDHEDQHTTSHEVDVQASSCPASTVSEQFQGMAVAKAGDVVAAEIGKDGVVLATEDVILQAPTATKPLSGVQQLLAICGQPSDESLIPSMHNLIASLADIRSVVKVGEGSFGEAYRYKKTVFKVIPVEGAQHMNGGPQKRADEVAAEALMALALSRLRTAGTDNVTNGFVNTERVALCHGPYAPSLVKAWHAWDKKHGSENDPVDCLTSPQQLFLVLAMEDCGRDLEKADVKSFDQARSLIVQVVFALAVAESAYEFEHRDLHWGNILLRLCVKPHLRCKLQGQDISIASHGIEVSLIDFTASRLRNQDGIVAFCDLSQDQELFQGPAKHIQFDTYRWMQQLTGDDWSAPCLETNVLWVAYLAEVVHTHKCSTFSTTQKRALREFRKRAVKMSSCRELVHDAFVQDIWQTDEQL